MWAVLLEKFHLGGGACPEAAASLQAAAAQDCILGLVEVRQAGGRKDVAWTENHGHGYNVLGQMLYRMVEAIRRGHWSTESPEAKLFLSFDSFGSELRSLLCKDVFEYL